MTTERSLAERLDHLRPDSDGRLVGLPLELLGIVVVGTALRLFQLGKESLWIDEALSITFATERTLRYLVIELPQLDPHPPLYYVLLYGWLRLPFVNQTETMVRLFSVLLGIATIPILYAIGRRVFDRWAGGVAALFFAVSPFQIWYAQEARMYTLFVFLTVASFFALLKVLDERSILWATAYVLAAVLLGYTHVFGAFVLAAQAIYLLWQGAFGTSSRVSLLEASALIGTVLLLLLPWEYLLIERVLFPTREVAEQTTWIQAPGVYSLWQVFTLSAFGYAYVDVYSSLSAPPGVIVFIPVAVFATVWLASLATGRTNRELLRKLRTSNPAVVLLLLWLLTPVVLPFIVSVTAMPIFAMRYIIVAAPAIFLLLAGSVRFISYSTGRNLLVAVLIIGMLVPLPGYYANDQKSEWRDATQYLETNGDSDDLIFVIPDWSEAAFDYYYDNSSASATAVPVRYDDTQRDFRETRAGYDDIYVLVSQMTPRDNREYLLNEFRKSTDKRLRNVKHFKNINVYVFTNASTDTNQSTISHPQSGG